jgi:small subunit ribosomal protein S4e
MGKKGGDTRVKRQISPNFWAIKRKQSQYVMRINPGPHPKHRAYPLGMLLRDVLNVASTRHEVDRILKADKIKVDAIVRRDPNFAVGLMDVVELPMGQAYRMIPKNSVLLAPIAIEDAEKRIKLIRITRKSIVRESKIQYGFHDSKTLMSDQKMKVGDTCVIDLPEVKIRNNIAFDKNNIALIITGENAGRVGRIEEIKDGIFSLPKRTLVSFDDKSVELPIEMVMVVGTDRPVIRVN